MKRDIRMMCRSFLQMHHGPWYEQRCMGCFLHSTSYWCNESPNGRINIDISWHT